LFGDLLIQQDFPIITYHTSGLAGGLSYTVIYQISVGC